MCGPLACFGLPGYWVVNYLDFLLGHLVGTRVVLAGGTVFGYVKASVVGQWCCRRRRLPNGRAIAGLCMVAFEVPTREDLSGTLVGCGLLGLSKRVNGPCCLLLGLAGFCGTGPIGYLHSRTTCCLAGDSSFGLAGLCNWA